MPKSAASQQYRQSEAGRAARRAYNMSPEVKAHKAVKEAMKKHQTPPPIRSQ